MPQIVLPVPLGDLGLHPGNALPGLGGNIGGGHPSQPIYHPGHPSHGLPSGGHIGNQLPWSPGHPDNSLPVPPGITPPSPLSCSPPPPGPSRALHPNPSDP